jgi:hypothetical protein
MARFSSHFAVIKKLRSAGLIVAIFLVKVWIFWAMFGCLRFCLLEMSRCHKFQMIQTIAIQGFYYYYQQPTRIFLCWEGWEVKFWLCRFQIICPPPAPKDSQFFIRN